MRRPRPTTEQLKACLDRITEASCETQLILSKIAIAHSNVVVGVVIVEVDMVISLIPYLCTEYYRYSNLTYGKVPYSTIVMR